MHNSVKLIRVFPDLDAPLFASLWASTADRNREFFQIKHSKSVKLFKYQCLRTIYGEKGFVNG